MRRRDFLASSMTAAVAGAVGATFGVSKRAEAAPLQTQTALTVLRRAKELEAAGNVDRLKTMYHPQMLRVDPSAVSPMVGRDSVADKLRVAVAQRQLAYFHYRQPQVVPAGNAAIVVSNYEAGYTEAGKTVEDSGKSANIVLLTPGAERVAVEVLVPNIYAGSYGARGMALARPRFGRFPARALGQPPFSTPTTAGGGQNDVLFSLVRRINAAWVAGTPETILRMANPTGVFLIGDYSPYYLSGTQEIREHFADFYKDGRVNRLQELNPTVRIFGSAAAVAFDFDLDYVVGGQQRQSPGRAVYGFIKAAQGQRWGMAYCTASHLVDSNIGDPYPLPSD